MDAAKIRARGPWVLVKLDSVATMSPGGLYLPEGNLQERLGHHTGVILSAGKETEPLRAGDRVMFRGYLKEANRPCGELDRDYSLIHIRDIIGTVEP